MCQARDFGTGSWSCGLCAVNNVQMDSTAVTLENESSSAGAAPFAKRLTSI
jgi:hypothetical protein